VTGKAEEKAVALGVAVGSGYLYKTTFEKEVYSDLYGERGCLMGGIHGMFLAQYEVLRERGHSPSEAFNETVEEATQSLYPLIGANGMDWMYAACSTTARRGAIDWSSKFKDTLKPVFNELYDSVRDGTETKRSLEFNSQPDYREKYEQEMKQIRELEIWRAGKAVRWVVLFVSVYRSLILMQVSSSGEPVNGDYKSLDCDIPAFVFRYFWLLQKKSPSDLGRECPVHLPDWADVPSLEFCSSTFDDACARAPGAFPYFLIPLTFGLQCFLTMSNPKSHLSSPSPSFSGLPLTPENVRLAHSLIKPYIHRTPLLTCQTLNNLASTPRRPGGANPKINLYFKCENYQKIGAFKARRGIPYGHSLDRETRPGRSEEERGSHAQ
jgi:Acetohydroxy acid isomeroreductase, catalytic domain